MGDLLARLLGEPPSVAVFEQILAHLDEHDGPAFEAALAQAEQGLRGWPDELRCAGEQLFDEDWKLRPFARLARKLEFEPSHAGCDPDLVQRIARAPELGNLTILNLLSEDIDCDGAEAIANSPTLARLKELRLGDQIADSGLCAIASSPHLQQLERLELRGYIAEDDTAEILANSPHMAKLVDLQLEDDGLGDDGLWALGMSAYIPAELRAHYLEQLDEDTLRDYAEELGEATEGSKESLIERLLGRAGA